MCPHIEQKPPEQRVVVSRKYCSSVIGRDPKNAQFFPVQQHNRRYWCCPIWLHARSVVSCGTPACGLPAGWQRHSFPPLPAVWPLHSLADGSRSATIWNACSALRARVRNIQLQVVCVASRTDGCFGATYRVGPRVHSSWYAFQLNHFVPSRT